MHIDISHPIRAALTAGSFVLALSSISLPAQDPGFAEWFGGDLGATGADIAPVPGGGGDFYVCGNSAAYNQHLFGVGTENEISFPSFSPWGRPDSFLARYRDDGTPVWVRMQYGDRIDQGRRLATFDDGSVLLIADYDMFVSGLPASGVTVQGGNNPDVVLPAQFSEGALLAKYSPDGDLEWARNPFASRGGRWVSAAAALPDGSFVLVGYFRGATFGDAADPTPISMPLGGSYGFLSSDGFVARYSATGDAEWVERIKGLAADNVSDVVRLDDGDIVIVGEVGRRDILPIDFFPGHPAEFTIPLSEAESRYLIRLDVSQDPGLATAAFTVQWWHTFSAYGSLTGKHRLALGPAGELYCAGIAPADFRTDPVHGTVIPSSYSDAPFMSVSNRPRHYVMRVDPADGSLLWVGGNRHVSTSGAVDIFADGEGVYGIATGGYSSQIFDALDNDQGDITFTGRFKFDQNGQVLWVRRDGSRQVACAGIGGGRAVTTGNYSGRGGFDLGLPTQQFTNLFVRGYPRGFIFEFMSGAATSLDVPDDVTRSCDPGANGATVFFVVEVSGAPAGATLEVVDGAGNVLVSELDPDGQVGVPGSLFPIGVTAVTARLIDGAGTEILSESFTITVEDATAPVLVGCAPVSIECTGPETLLVAPLLGVSATDDCDPNPTVRIEPDHVGLGTTQVRVVGRDQTGNTSDCFVDVTVVDTIAPFFTVAPEDIERECTDHAGYLVAFDVLAEDVCGVASMVCTDQTGAVVDPAGSHFCVGVHTVTCTATDSSGNAAQHVFTVTVYDNTAPVLEAPDDITQANDPGLCTAAVPFAATATDRCDPNVLIVYDVDGAPVQSGDDFPIGTTTVRAVATDRWGNQAEVEFGITVYDAEPPAFGGNLTGLATLVTDCAGAALTPSADDLGLTVTDNCDPNPVVGLAPAVLQPGVHVVAVTATDVDGNADVTTVSVTVLRGPFDCEVLRPLDSDVDNRIRAGRVVPIKLRVACENQEVTDATVVVDRIDVLNASGTPVANEPVEDPGLSHDNGNVFRLAGSHYHFNLSTSGWSGASGLRHRVTVRIQKAGHVDTICELFYVNR